MQDSHDTVRMFIEIITDTVLEHRNIDQAVAFGHTNLLAEIPQGGRRIAATAQAGDGRHPWIIPAAHDALFNELAQFAFTRDGIREIQTGELNLARTRIRIESQ